MIYNTRSCKSFLSEELARRMKNNPKYSLRAFSRHLNMSPGELSEIIRGKRALSPKSALRVARSMRLSTEETKYLLLLAQAGQKGVDGGALLDRSLPRHELTLDLFHVVSDWYCFAILNLAETEDFKWSPKFIAQRLGIQVHEARLGLERLERVGLIEKKGVSYRLTQDHVFSPDGIPSEAIRNFHRQVLEKAIRSLETQDISERDITGISLSLDPSMIGNIKKDISDFLDQIVKKYGHGRKTEVYHLETTFFRLTERRTK